METANCIQRIPNVGHEAHNTGYFFSCFKDVQIGQRMMTISTVGVPNTIKKLASHKLQSTLAVRYAAFSNNIRSEMIAKVMDMISATGFRVS